MLKRQTLGFINILLSGTLLNGTKLYKNVPLKFYPLKRSFSLLGRTQCFASITALIFSSPVLKFIQQTLGTDVKMSQSSAG